MNDTTDEQPQFSFCDKVDLHVNSFSVDLDSVVSVALEHNFRAIVVPMAILSRLSNINLKKNNIKNVAIIDFPYGNSILDVRTYSIYSAKDSGADEVEIVFPYYLSRSDELVKEFTAIVETCEKLNLTLRYVFDQNNDEFPKEKRTKLYQLISCNKIKNISASLGHFDIKVDHSENVLKMRSMKAFTKCKTKIFLNTDDPQVFSLYPKAGVDLIGIEWNKAPKIVHGYEELVQIGSNKNLS